jgi:hypothetical protein
MLQLGRLGQHRNQSLGGFRRPLPLQSPPRLLRLKHEAQGNGLGRALKLCPERAALGVKDDLLFGHQLVADGQPLAVKPLGSLMNFGYEGTLVLPVPVTVPEGPLADTLPVRLQAQWLVCKDGCIPEEGSFAVDLPTRQTASADTALFESAFASTPVEAADVRASARVEADAIVVTLAGLPTAWAGQRLHFMPETPGVIDNAAAPQARWDASSWQARVALSARVALKCPLRSVLRQFCTRV